MRTFLPFVVLVSCLIGAAGTAQADSTSEYNRWIQLAVSEFDTGNWTEARALFQRAHELNPNARTWRGLGITAFELRRYVDAIAELEASLADARKPLAEKQRNEVTELLQRARQFVAVYQLSIEPEGADVLVDGQPVSLRDGRLYLDPGNHTVVVRAPGYEEARKDLRVTDPRRDELKIELKVAGHDEGTLASPASPQAAARADVSSSEPSARPKRVWAWALGGSAIAAGAVGLGLAVVTSKKNDDLKTCAVACDDIATKGKSLQLGTNIVLGTSGALLVGAVVAWFVEGRSGKETPKKAALFLHPRGAGIQGQF